MASSRPRARFMHWTAAPAVPLARLSTAPTATSRPAASSTVTWRLHGVGAEHRLGLRPLALGQDVHERLVGVRLVVGVARRRRRSRRRASGRRAGGEDAAGHRHQERREADRHRRRRRAPVRFWTISGVCRWVPPTPYGAGVAHHLAAEQVRLGGLAGAAGAGGGDDDDVGARPGRRRRPGRGPGWRPSGSSRGRRSGGRRAAASRWPGELGQAVGPGAGVLAAVERLPGAGSVSRKSAPQSMTTTSSPSARRSRPDWPCGRPRKTTSWPASVSSVVSLEDPVGQRHQVRLERAEPLAGVGPAGEGADLDLGVAQQQAQHLTPGVPAGSGDRDSAPRHVHDYTSSCMFMRHRVEPAMRCRRSRATTVRCHDPPCPLETTSTTSRPSPPASARCSPTATPPRGCRRCPDWNAADLLWHLAERPALVGAGPCAAARPEATRRGRAPRARRRTPTLLAAFDE